MSSNATHPSTPATSKSLRVAGVALAIVVFLCGVVVRWQWCYHWHDPRQAQYSDMKFYIQVGQRIARPDYALTKNDITHPPGMSLMVAASIRLHEWIDRDELGEVDPLKHPLRYVALANFLASIGVPLCVALWAWAAFGRGVGWAALAAASAYFPFIHYGGYFLAEVYVMALIPLAAALFLLGARARRGWVMATLCLAAGVTVAVGTGFKLVVLPGLACMGLTYLVFHRAQPWRLRVWVIALILIGAAPGLTWLSVRSTRANEGQWCLVSNKNAADFLLGHYGRIRGIRWRDAKTGAQFQFGSPAAVQRGYNDIKPVNFSMTDSKANYDEAWRWIRLHPDEAIVLSLQHVYDLFFGDVPWPSGNGATALWAEGFQYVFVALLLLPAVALMGAVLVMGRCRSFFASHELLMVVPVLGLMFSAFMATGELRYRLPWDSVFLILALQAARLAFHSLRRT